MGILDLLRDASRRTHSTRTPVSSPWSSTALSSVVWNDIYGTDEPIAVTRAQAMKVPAIVKGRALIAGTLSRHPLAKYRYDRRVASDPWMVKKAGDISAQQRMLWTLDDILFGGCSLWAIERDTRGQVAEAYRVPPEWWSVDEDLQIFILDKHASPEEVCYFEGPQEGLTVIAQETIRGALAIESAWRDRVSHPVPLVDLHSTDMNMDLTQAEADELVSNWEKARANGGTAYTPSSIQLNVPSADTAPDLFIEGRNAVRLDIANFLNLPAQLLDGTTATASLTYTTQEGTRSQLVDFSLAYWATTIEQRLSLDDMTAAGSSIQFDIEWLTQTTQPAKGPNVED